MRRTSKYAHKIWGPQLIPPGTSSLGTALISASLMFCAFEGNPWIVRLFGTPTMAQPGEDGWEELAGLFPPQRGLRQVHLLDIDLAVTSCGFGVPLYSYEGQRDVLDSWAAKKGDDGLLAYQRQFNAESLDGLPTGLVQDGRHV
ncbi:MAG: hypothetical protein QM619_01050 [Micropruina sp.]|uniref:hypothetical protein n=1 Tax=Micropruina sp. TaxID=2737536 RepID=UPI0039E529DE